MKNKKFIFNGKTFTELSSGQKKPSGSVIVSYDEMYSFRALVNEGKCLYIENNEIKSKDREHKAITFNTWDDVRFKRDVLLSKSDFTQVADYPAEKKAAYAAYRQELRDLPKSFNDLNDIVWPTEPV